MGNFEGIIKGKESILEHHERRLMSFKENSNFIKNQNSRFAQFIKISCEKWQNCNQNENEKWEGTKAQNPPRKIQKQNVGKNKGHIIQFFMSKLIIIVHHSKQREREREG